LGKASYNSNEQLQRLVLGGKKFPVIRKRSRSTAHTLQAAARSCNRRHKQNQIKLKLHDYIIYY